MLATLRRLLRSLVRLAQGAALQAGMFLLYFLGLGITWCLVHLFQRRVLQREPPGLDSYWRPAQGYGAEDLESP